MPAPYNTNLGPGPYTGGFPSLGPAPTTGPGKQMHPELASYDQQMQGSGFKALPRKPEMGLLEKLRAIFTGTQYAPQERQAVLGTY